MKDGIWKLVCLIAVSITALHSTAIAQDSFRQFDRKLVATPAELFDVLSTFQPNANRKQVARERLQEIEQAGKKLLSGLSPEQQEKAWEYAEKYLRKNGVDSASSKNLLKEFGLPPEMQNELTKQFRKYANRRSNPESRPDGKPDDEISDLLQRAREKYRSEANAKTEAQSNEQPDQLDAQGEVSNSKRSPQGDNSLKPKSEQARRIPERNASTPGQNRRPNSSESKESRGKNAPELDDLFGQSSSNETMSENANSSETKNLSNPSSTSRRPETKKKPRPRLPASEAKKAQPNKTSRNSDIDLDKLLKRLKQKGRSLSGDGTTGTGPKSGVSSGGDLNWENVIKTLAEESNFGDGSERSDGNAASRLAGLDADKMLEAFQRARASGSQGEGKGAANLDKSLLNRAKELISGSIDPEKKPDTGGLAGILSGKSASAENVGTRFDRLLVKAAERTITSASEDKGVTKSVGSVFGNLVERIQDQAAKTKSEREKSAGSRSEKSKRGSNRNESSSRNENSASNSGSKSSSGSNRESGSRGSASASNSTTSNSGSSSIDPQKMLDRLRDISSINPTQVFTFLAIVGFVLFLAYLVTQSFVGNESAIKRRNVIKQVRSSNIQSPKDLVETVDVFLLGKFGIKSSWWNARIAQAVLNSGSPDLSERVDDLMRDYVRARYMRDDIQIPAADQKRYRKTLEELSLLDLSPKAELRLAAGKQVLSSPKPVKG